MEVVLLRLCKKSDAIFEIDCVGDSATFLCSFALIYTSRCENPLKEEHQDKRRIGQRPLIPVQRRMHLARGLAVSLSAVPLNGRKPRFPPEEWLHPPLRPQVLDVKFVGGGRQSGSAHSKEQPR